MANSVICAELQDGFDFSCVRSFPKGYYQEAVLINFSDIDRTASTTGNMGGATCDYSVQMVLAAAKKGVQIRLPQNGSTIKGWFEKKTSDKGMVEYLHKVQIMALGADAATKCKLDKLDHGLYVVVLQAKDGTVEVYGWENGITTGDYTYDITDGGGGAVIPLSSKEKEPESMLPLVYKPAANGSANADFNDQFQTP